MLQPHRLYSVRATVIAIVLLPLLAVFGGGGLLILGAVEDRIEARMQEDISLIARTLRTPLARSLERRREVSLDRALRSTSELGRVYGVYLYDSDGNLLAQADQAAGNRRPEGAVPEIESLDRGEYRSVGGREVYSYFTPLIGNGGQAIGMLQVTRRASDIRDYLTALRANVALVMLGLSGAFVGIVLLGYHIVIGLPLQRLSTVMRRVEGGDAQARVAATGPVELRALASRFNSMLAGLADRDAALRRERAEQALLEHKLRQSEKYALVGRLAAGVAHELGTPLSVIDGHAQRLLRGRAAGSRDHEVLTRIRESADRMGTIVRQLLGFGGEASAGRRPIPVQRLITLAAADSRAPLEREGVKLEIVAASPRAQIAADQARIREALGHLLRNAAQASNGGCVRIGWEETDDETRIFVENSGEPIPSCERDRIFEPFFTTKAPGEGSGLGLAIVKSVVADQEAEIEVYDSSLGGAGFRVSFRRIERDVETGSMLGEDESSADR